MATKKPVQFTQQALDDLMGVSPSRALFMAADLLAPSPDVTTYSDWVRKFLPNAFTIPLGPHQRWLCDQLQLQPNGSRIVLGAPRGAGKTALTLFGLPLAAIALGTHEFPVIVGPTQLEAEARLNSIRSELERNPRLSEQFPNLRFVPRPRSSRRHKVDTAREIQLAGGRIVAVGAEAKIRGIVRDSTSGKLVRPDLVLLDDVETPDQARSRMRTDRLEEWLFADLIGLGGGVRAVSVVFIGTTLASDAMMTRALKGRGRFRNWNTRAFPIVTTDSQGKEHLMWPERFPWAYIRSLTDPHSETYVGNFSFSREYMLDPQDILGAMWTEQMISDARHIGDLPDFKRIVVAVDPSWGTKGDECGIVVAGLSHDDVIYILEDLSGRMPPQQWGKTAIAAYERWEADRIIAEANFGAEKVRLVTAAIQSNVPFTEVIASRGKDIRAEPIVTLFERGRVKLAGHFDLLENQLLSWVPGQSHFSPDKLDAMVWACTYLNPSITSLPAELITPDQVATGTMGRSPGRGANVLPFQPRPMPRNRW